MKIQHHILHWVQELPFQLMSLAVEHNKIHFSTASYYYRFVVLLGSFHSRPAHQIVYLHFAFKVLKPDYCKTNGVIVLYQYGKKEAIKGLPSCNFICDKGKSIVTYFIAATAEQRTGRTEYGLGQ